MPGTRRVPLHRQVGGPLITPHAIEHYGALKRAERARRYATDCTLAKSGYCTAECSACEAWWDAHDALRGGGLWPCGGLPEAVGLHPGLSSRLLAAR
jgi:hypothetical protein